MAKEDSTSGLLSKVVKFVRNPATSWSELDSVQLDKDDSVSKQLLKEMIERKRRNDFVRKREFDMLRKLRKREIMAGAHLDHGDRPSFFQSSMPSRPDDRASTLKKIDEIEAQMSMQWWKTKTVHAPGNSVRGPLAPHGPSAAVTRNPLLDHELPTAYKLTEPAGLQSAAQKAAQAMTAQEPAPTRPDALSRASAGAGAVKRPGAPPAPGGLSFTGGSDDSSTSVFSASKSAAMEVEEGGVHSAELEDAAIRFAHGDDTGAEAVLLGVLGPGGARDGHAETWLALFDLYRATGEQDKFEIAAIEFVERFDRSAPQWFSMPDMVGVVSEPADKATHRPRADWICPSALGIQTVAALKAALGKAPMPWRLDWRNLKTIEAAAVEPLTRVFSGWSAQPVQLRFIGDAQLKKVLQDATPSGNRDAAQNRWQLRMEVLRVTHRPDDFELAALDFCVTYEVSPPSWSNARCDYKPIDAQGGVVVGSTIPGGAYLDSAHSNFSVSDSDSRFDGPSSRRNNLLSVELSGHIHGDAIAALDKLEGKLMGADTMEISCTKLIRVDFSATGALLNWVVARAAENCTVQFSDVNRLVAAFFNVIGITEHAGVVVRVD
ncbi:MAG: STAS domain-containing protein [Polaromonas sp.]